MTEPRDPRGYIEDMLENLALAQQFTAGLNSAAELAADRRNLYAVVKALEIVGEAAKNVPPAVRDLAPEVPWTQITGMRDRLIHGYRDVDLKLVWRTARERTAEAEPQLRALLAHLEAEGATPPE